MGYQKFYKTPAGRVRAYLLAQKADLFGLGTVEFGLVQMHVNDVLFQEYVFRLQVLDNLTDVAYMSSIGAITKESGMRYMQNVQKHRTSLANILSPNYNDRDKGNDSITENKMSTTDAGKMNYIKLLSQLNNKGTMGTLMGVKDVFDKALTEKSNK